EHEPSLREGGADGQGGTHRAVRRGSALPLRSGRPQALGARLQMGAERHRAGLHVRFPHVRTAARAGAGGMTAVGREGLARIFGSTEYTTWASRVGNLVDARKL